MNNQKLTAKGFIKNLAGFSMGTWIGALINFAAVPIATRLYPAQQLGIIELFITTLNLLATAIMLGMDQAYLRYYNEPPGGYSQKQLLTRCTATTLLSWLVASAGILCFAAPLSGYIAETQGLFIAFMLIGNLLATVLIRYLNLNLRMQNSIRGYTLQSVLMVFFSKAFYVAAAIVDSTYRGAILVNTITMLLLAGVYLFFQRKSFDFSGIRFAKAENRMLLRYALPLAPVAVLTWLNDSAAKYFIKFFGGESGLANVAVFSSATKLTSILALVQAGFNTYWISFVYANYKTAHAHIRKIHNYISAAMMLLAVVLVAAEEPIFWFLGSDVRGGITYFPILLLSPVLLTISETTCIGIGISKKSYLHMLSTGLSTLVSVIICITLISRLGDLGGAVAMAASALTMYILRTVFGQRYYSSILSPVTTAASVLILTVFSVLASIFTHILWARLLTCFVTAVLLLILYRKEVMAGFRLAAALCRKKPKETPLASSE